MICSIEGCEKKSRTLGWCVKHYARWKRYGDPEVLRPVVEVDIRIRLWEKTIIDPSSGCWVWTGLRNKKGYGSLSWRGKTISVHRASYFIFKGDIPEGMHIDHVRAWGCTSTSCWNPAHLEAVTPAENTRRERLTRAKKTHCLNGHPYDNENTEIYSGRRRCKACNRAQAAAYQRHKRMVARGELPPDVVIEGDAVE